MEENQEFTLLFQPPTSMQKVEEQKGIFLRKTISLYIHIPFCEKKCFFCSIVTCQKYNDEYIENYVQVLIQEIYSYREYFRINKVDGIHIGGGTPSLIKLEQIERIFKALRDCVEGFDDLEVAFEGEASTYDDEKIDFLAETGQVAINLGVQTFDGEIFRKINRWSRPELIIDRIEYMAKKNFRAIGIDVMCNLPYGTLETSIADIDMARKLNVNHIALYPLRIEPDSIFYEYHSKYEAAFINEEKQLANYTYVAEYLRNKGYDHYNVFHFSNQKEPTFIYARNQMYGGEWLGLGVAAYSYYNSSVFANTRDVDEYVKYGDKRMWFQDENNAMMDIFRQFVFSLRQTRIKREWYYDKFGEPTYHMFFAPIIAYLKKDGFIDDDGKTFQLSDRGIVNFPNIESDILDNYEKIIENYSVMSQKLKTG